MATKKISELNSLTSVDSADILPIVDISAGETKKISFNDLVGNRLINDESNISTLSNQRKNGWNNDLLGYTVTYVSYNSTTLSGVINIAGDVTQILSAGMKLMYTQSTTKYAIVLAVGTYSGGVTPVTIFCGTDYTLTNTAITNVYFSIQKQPFAFPTAIEKWCIKYNIASKVQASPTQNVYYNCGSFVIPIGSWKMETNFQGKINRTSSGQGSRIVGIGSSTIAMDSGLSSQEAVNGTGYIGGQISINAPISVTTNTTKYVNMYTADSGLANLILDSGVIYLYCAYL